MHEDPGIPRVTCTIGEIAQVQDGCFQIGLTDIDNRMSGTATISSNSWLSYPGAMVEWAWQEIHGWPLLR